MLLSARCRLGFGQFNCTNSKQFMQQYRVISTELATALRPFYFAVHPDLFGQHPVQRSVNEDSLKQLSGLIETVEQRSLLQETKILQFYIRDISSGKRDNFKLIRLKLDGTIRDPKTIVQRLLELCNLPTECLKNIKTTKTNNHVDLRDLSTKSQDFADFTYNFYQAKQAEKKTLNSWITENADLARARTNAVADLHEEVAKLQKVLIERLGLQDVRYDCGWIAAEHFRGCLKTLERLANMHEKHIEHLKGRVVIFAPFTGVSLEGHVMLYTGDVLNNWIDFIKNIPKHDAFLAKIPLYENTLSQVLRNIRIGRRKFMPKQQAKGYAGHLTKVTTTLGDYLTTKKYPKSWPASLSDYEIVIESEAGPLMVSPTGQLIAPATCPGFILVDFITSSLDVAKERTKRYKEQKYIEKELVERTKRELKLRSLTKDDSVTPDKMIKTLQNLLSSYKAEAYSDINLHITNYYSVLGDGLVCIPWDFFNR